MESLLVAAAFHYVRDDLRGLPATLGAMTPRALELQLDVLGACFTFVSADDVIDGLEGRRALPRRALALTFDDGLAEHFELVWPLLQRKGIPALFHVCTRPIESGKPEPVHVAHLVRAHAPLESFSADLIAHLVRKGVPLDAARGAAHDGRDEYGDVDKLVHHVLGVLLPPDDARAFLDAERARMGISAQPPRYMTAEQLRVLDDAGALGLRAHGHRPLGRMSAADAALELSRAHALLTSWGITRARSLSYPVGTRESCTPAVAEAARRLGFRVGFTMERAVNRDVCAPMFLARFSHTELPGAPNHRLTFDDVVNHVGPATWHRSVS
jgi:peptidoglycan/xylan/chitin deacetylase (PgdA/CDA1 family)